MRSLHALLISLLVSVLIGLHSDCKVVAQVNSSVNGTSVSKLRHGVLSLENKVLAHGIFDLKSRATKQARMLAVNDLLCVTLASSASRTSILHDNILRMGKTCHWAIIYYNNNPSQAASRCAALPKKEQVVHCKMFPLAKRFNITGTSSPLPVPKSVLYTEVMPYINDYKRVFVMDEDISLSEFDYATFSQLWDCAFDPPPLIVQPVIAESSQSFEFFNAKGWSRWRHRKTLASASGYIEPQVPLFNAAFFQWYVRRVLANTLQIVLKTGSDCGFDRTWCNAARTYSGVVLGHVNATAVCAVLPGGTMVRHLEDRTTTKHHEHDCDNSTGYETIDAYANLFPKWIQSEHGDHTNPLKQENNKKYPRIYKHQIC